MDARTGFSEETVGMTGRLSRARDWLHGHRRWFLFVALPTLLVALYYGLFAANQYESEAHFMVRSSEEAPQVGGLGQALTLVGGVSNSQTEANSVGDYLSSHDAVAALQRRVNLVAIFRRPEADLFTRLHPADPTAETLLSYYRKHVDVRFDTDSGIATLRVRTFRPGDSYAIITNMLRLGEDRVNSLNERAYRDTLGAAERQLTEARANVARIQSTVTAYRQGTRDINPQATGQAQIQLVSQLQAQLAAARAQEQAMAGSLAPNSPQLVAMRARVAGIQAQVSAASSRLTSGSRSIAVGLGGSQGLELRQQFAAKQFEAASAAVQSAREQAIKQQLFIVRVVEPNLPQKALYPKSLKIVVTVFFGLMLLYAIGWLIAAGVREHAS